MPLLFHKLLWCLLTCCFLLKLLFLENPYPISLPGEYLLIHLTLTQCQYLHFLLITYLLVGYLHGL